MSDTRESLIKPAAQNRGWSLERATWGASVIVLIILTATYFLVPSNSRLFFGHKEPSGSFILSLASTVTDEQGIPYSGTVLYDTASKTYSYIATADEGVATPVDVGAFSSGTYYLAMRAGNESNDFVLYDSSTLAPVRVIQNLPIGALVTATAWAPDGEVFAYLLMGVPVPALFIDHVDSTIGAESPGFDVPVGFSPDGSKILTRGTSTPVVINIEDGSYVQTAAQGVSFAPETKLILAPSREYFVAVSDSVVEWYHVDWSSAQITSLGKVSLGARPADILFGPSDLLLIREEGSEKGQIYSYEPGEGVVKESSMKLSLPEGARILHVVSW